MKALLIVLVVVYMVLCHMANWRAVVYGAFNNTQSTKWRIKQGLMFLLSPVIVPVMIVYSFLGRIG